MSVWFLFSGDLNTNADFSEFIFVIIYSKFEECTLPDITPVGFFGLFYTINIFNEIFTFVNGKTQVPVPYPGLVNIISML